MTRIFKITICGNTETIFEHHDTCDLSNEDLDSMATNFVEDVARMIDSAALPGVAVRSVVCSEYCKYHGGKFAEQAKVRGQTGGLVSCDSDALKIVKELCERAADDAAERLKENLEAELAEREIPAE